jgi:hypothetical protein
LQVLVGVQRRDEFRLEAEAGRLEIVALNEELSMAKARIEKLLNENDSLRRQKVGRW